MHFYHFDQLRGLELASDDKDQNQEKKTELVVLLFGVLGSPTALYLQ